MTGRWRRFDAFLLNCKRAPWVRGVAMIGVLEEIARVIVATSRGTAGIWAGRAGNRVMFRRFRVTASC